MKKMLSVLSLAVASAFASVAAHAETTPDHVIGTWRSPQALDTTIKIARTANGLAVSEIHQNFFGGARVESRPATLKNNLLLAGTTSFHYDEKSGVLLYFVPPNYAISFRREAN